MKKYSVIVLIALLVQQSWAATLYDQLCEFNFNWKKYKLQAPQEPGRLFSSDKEYVQAHLTNVLRILRGSSTAHLNPGQLRSRMHMLELLDGYRLAGKFPMNYYRPERIPVFIDEHNTHCAVAYLMEQTGHEEMALRIATADNYAWVKDIQDAGLAAWQEASGLSVEELKLIQGAYDYYIPDALYLANKYEVPQKPSVMKMYFENPSTGKSLPAKEENIWVYGEGKNGVLNGKWVQNFAVGVPWIVGYYENGKRTGQWEEYYQGTNKLCRTEVWRNDKLNGIRRRFDIEGKLIEEILFKDGNAITKTNYDLLNNLVYVRKPLDASTVYTEVFTTGGSMIAAGNEKIHNPGNLQWFQNIELTALNSIAVGARDHSFSPSITLSSIYIPNRPGRSLGRSYGSFQSFSSTPLVEYKKEGEWKYYREYNNSTAPQMAGIKLQSMLSHHFPHFGSQLYQSVSMFEDLKHSTGYDSLRVVYSNNYVQKFYGYGQTDYAHLQLRYYTDEELIAGNTVVGSLVIPNNSLDLYAINNGISVTQFANPYISYPQSHVTPVLKEAGQYNQENEKIGVWKHFGKDRQLYKTENYLVAWKE